MKKILFGIVFFLGMSPAVFAAQSIFDFVAAANSGEQGFDPSYVITVGGIQLTVTATNTAGAGLFPYLDSGHGGLGVCGSENPLSSTAQCVPSSDDNIKPGEILSLSFDQAVTVNQMWFNNRHDGDGSLSGDQVKIGGTVYSVFSNTQSGALANFNNDWSPGTGTTAQTFSFAANTQYLIENPNAGINTCYGQGGSTDNCEFYLSGMTVTAVPEPEIYAMLAAGLGLMGFMARRRKKFDDAVV